MSNKQDPFTSIDTGALENVTGGAVSVASGAGTGGDDQLMLMLTQLTSSLNDLAQNANGGGNQSMEMMMMMMMAMGGFGGQQQAAAPQQPIVIPSGGCGGW